MRNVERGRPDPRTLPDRVVSLSEREEHYFLYRCSATWWVGR